MSVGIIQFLVLALCVSNTQSKCLFGDTDHCVFPCRCSGSDSCDSRTGQCFQGQCLTGQSLEGDNKEEADENGRDNAEWAWHGPACQIGNVALGKKAISNDHSAAMGEWADPNAMTDGITKSSTRTCPVIWTMDSKPAAWLVDLKVPHKVSGFTLYLFSKAVGKLKVTVGNSTALSEHVTCALLTTNKRLGKKLYTELNCSNDIIGRYVSVVKNPETDSFPDSLELCEIAVTGHLHVNVDWTQCMDQNFNELWCMQCQNSLPPTCADPCPHGKYGLNCKLSCEPCDGACDPQSGKCMDSISSPTKAPAIQLTTAPESGIHDVVFGSEDTTLNDEYVTGSSTGLWDHTDIESMVSVHVEKDTDTDGVTMTREAKQCVEGFFGDNCSKQCGMCFQRDSCDMDTGRCPDGCADWYIGQSHECDTLVARLDLTQDNIIVTSLSDGFKIQLTNIPNINPELSQHYRGELRYFPNDGSYKPNSQKYMLNFYPINGSFESELIVDSLKSNMNYDVSIAIYRMLDGRINSGTSVSTSVSTSDVKALPRQSGGLDPNHYSFIIMLTVLITLVICVTGTLVYLCLRARKRKSLDDSQTETESSSDFCKETVVYPTKMEPDPVYHFIDDGGDTRYHLYHDINDFSRDKCQNFSNNNALKRFSTSAVERDVLMGNAPRMRSSFVPEMNELHVFRPSYCPNSEKMTNHGYLTTASLGGNLATNSWDAHTKLHQPTSETPRYIKASQQGAATQHYPSPTNMHHPGPLEESDYLMPRSARMITANQVQDYMSPVSRYPSSAERNPRTGQNSGYIPMDSPTEEGHRPRYSHTHGNVQREQEWGHRSLSYDESQSEGSTMDSGNKPAHQSYVHMA